MLEDKLLEKQFFKYKLFIWIFKFHDKFYLNLFDF